MADISKINAVLIANIAEIDDVLAANIAKVNGLVFSTAPAVQYLLDLYTGAAAAYSTRRLYSLYTGAALRVREDSGDTETDIGFDSNGDLDTAAIATHCGTANGYVTKWYGQESSGGTGSGNDAEQSTGTAQPQIYNGTAVITENGKPAVEFDGSNDYFLTPSFVPLIRSASQVFLKSTSTTSSTIWRHNQGSIQYIRQRFTTSFDVRFIGDDTTGLFNTQTMAICHTSSDPSVGGTAYTYLNGTESSSSEGSFSVTTSGAVGIGAAPNGTELWLGTIQEVILWTTHRQSDNSGIEGNVNAHFQIGNFGTPTSGLLATYSGAAAAYSVRQLANTAALAMRIREDGGDTETDIGFDSNGDLDTAAIASHCATNNGYVVTWFDQSGEQNDATQGTASDQPQIYNGTAVLTLNGKPAVSQRADNYNGTFDGTGISGNTLTVIQVVDTSNSAGGGSANTGRALSAGAVVASFRAEMFLFQGTALSATVAKPSAQTLGMWFFKETDEAYQNGTQVITGNAGTGNATSVTLLGQSGSTRVCVATNELIIYLSDQSSNRTGIETNINSDYLIYQPTDAPTSGLLATYTGAAAAYSVRQLSDKAVIAITVRRDSDDEEKRFGFDANGDLDTTGIADFCTTANGYVSQWWDQSTNGNHASQATSGNQPQIYNGTAVITENGKSAVDFRSLQHLTLTSTNLITAFSVGRADTDNVNSENYIMSGTVLWGYNRTFSSDDSIGVQVGSDRVSVGTATDNNQKLGYVNNQSGTQYVAQDGGTASSGSVSSGAVTMIGNRLPRTYYTLNGTIQEIVIWTTDESSDRTGIETNINDYFSIY